MLLEEQYYQTGEGTPNQIWEGDVNHNAEVKKSPAKTSASASGSSSRWSKEEKDLFEEGLVKSYARQYFKHKVKSEPRAAAPSAGPSAPLQPPQPTSSHASMLTNTVRIERLSDEEDEEVDITDDLSEDGDAKPQVVIKTEICEPEQPQSSEIQKDSEEQNHLTETRDQPSPRSLSPQSPQLSPSSSEKTSVTGIDEKDNEREYLQPENVQAAAQTDLEQMTDEIKGQSSQSKNSAKWDQLEEACGDGTDSADKTEQNSKLHPGSMVKDQAQVPEQDIGPPWTEELRRCKLHRENTHLPGAHRSYNFNCEQAVYNRPRVLDRSKHKEGKDVLEAYQIAQRLQSMVASQCRELALRREEMKKHPKPCKIPRFKGSFDPFQLIPCRYFGEDVQEPFQVIVCAETLLIMDMHAHVSRGEVIGLLGGLFNEEDRVLKICAAEPCNSVSTGLQCEMDPVSQTQACDVLSNLGFSVVGWYHSHPTFHPNPSVRDITTQDQFQSYFSRGGAPFIGMIVKLPYRFDFLSSQDIPDWEQTWRRAQWIIHKYSQTPWSVKMDRCFRKDSTLTFLEKMLSSLARYLEPLPDEEGDPFLTRIQALFQSDFISKQQPPDQEEGESLNISSRPVDSDDFAFDQLISEDRPPEGGRGSDPESGRASGSSVQTTDTSSEMNSSTVLHLGSVLSSEHDYLL
ncbi:hypothetical protein KUCAC02_022839 [Chaenocephalus aceratus]|uniref:Uncharacterized protein n=1 Tax=Chaenocephalus aceratus TaxID=36190 RepID=A0ACB9XP68_CHAAC|nr:hypothetical protein KUCAC02_022839 [Chaenocephalus aceratus]